MQSDHKKVQACLWVAAAFSTVAQGAQWVISDPVSIQWSKPLKTAQLAPVVPQRNDKANNRVVQKPVASNEQHQTGIGAGDISDPFDQFEDADDYYAFLEEFKNITGWINPRYDKGNHDKTDLAMGFSTETAGFSVGATSELNFKTRIGAAFTYDKTKVKGDDKEEVQLSTMMGSFYTRWSDRKFFFDSEFAVGSAHTDRDRKMDGMTYSGKFDTRMISANITTGKHFRHRGWNIDPGIALNYSLISFDDHVETSNTNQKNKVMLKDFEVMEVGLGITIDRSYWGKSLIRRGRYQTEFSLTGYYDASSDTSSIRARIPTGRDSFVITSPKKDRFRVEGKMGLTITSYKRFKFNTSYRFNRSVNYLSHGVSADFRYQF